MNNHLEINPHSKIVITGAGIGGLTTALALHTVGFKNITIIESAKSIKPLGLGINLQPEAVEVLYKLGLADHLQKTGIVTAELRYTDQTGAALWSHPCGTFAGNAYPQYSIHRGELQMLLLEAVNQQLGSHVIQLGSSLERIEQATKKVTLHCRRRQSKDISEISGDLLIGADGINSVVCSTLHPLKNAISWSPITMWRGTTLMNHFLDGQTMVITHDQHWSRLVAYPISKRYANKGKALVNWVCLVPNAMPKRGNIADWNTAGNLSDVLPYFEHWDLDWLDVASLLNESQMILQYPMVDRDPLPFWSQGRITMLGDAAHLMYPTGANGASQAILDATVLAHSLSKANNLNIALAEYENKRRDAAYRLVLANRNREREEWAVAAAAISMKRAAINSITSNYDHSTAISRKAL